MKTVFNMTKYIEEILGIKSRPVLWGKSRAMPVFIRNLYYLYESTLIDSRILFIIDKCSEDLTPASIKKHISIIREKWGREIVYVKDTLSSFNRKRLIEHKIPFIIPGNQMYLPMEGIDLREYFRKSITEKSVFSPSTQMFLLSVVINDDHGPHCPKDIAEKLGYSQMTFSRVFDELEAEGIGVHSTLGKERFVKFSEHKKELWEKVKPYLKSPVKKRIHFNCKINKEKYLAGFSALSTYSMIADPADPVYAVSSDVWKEINRKKRVDNKKSSVEKDFFQIEIWKYDPGLLSKNGIVDPFSLYLCFRDENDERILSAIEHMMENYKW